MKIITVMPALGLMRIGGLMRTGGLMRPLGVLPAVLPAVLLTVLLTVLLVMPPHLATAHHTLGVSQTGKATESPQIPVDHEIQVDGMLFQVTIMPSNPAPGQLTRVIAHAKRLPSMAAYQGEMRFRITETFWFWRGATILDQTRLPTDGRYVQSVQFPDKGTHSILLEIKSNGRFHRAEVPLTVGDPGGMWKVLLGLLAAVALGWVVRRAAYNRRRPRPV